MSYEDDAKDERIAQLNAAAQSALIGFNRARQSLTDAVQLLEDQGIPARSYFYHDMESINYHRANMIHALNLEGTSWDDSKENTA